MSGFGHPTNYVNVESIYLRHALNDIDSSLEQNEMVRVMERWGHLFDGNERTEFLTHFSLKYEELESML